MDDRNCEGWAEEGRPDMGEAVSVPPSLVVSVGDVGGGYSFDGLFKVFQNSAFVFDGGH